MGAERVGGRVGDTGYVPIAVRREGIVAGLVMVVDS